MSVVTARAWSLVLPKADGSRSAASQSRMQSAELPLIAREVGVGVETLAASPSALR